MREPAIVGMGAVSSLGEGCAALRDGVAAGRHGMVPGRRFELAGHGDALVGLVPSANHSGCADAPLTVQYAVRAIREAAAHASLPEGARMALLLGLPASDDGGRVHELALAIRHELGWTCPTIAVSSACCSATAAIALGAHLLEDDRFDVVVAGGAEALSADLHAGFHSLGALASGPCSPFSEEIGTTLAEGAGFVVLQQGARHPLAYVQGVGLSNDAWHETSPHPRGEGLALAARAAIDDAGCLPDGIHYVNAHGTGTLANDVAETLALRAVFGAIPPVSSTKGHLGHAQAAAGSLECIATLLVSPSVPPSLRAEPRREHMPPDVVTDLRPLPWTRFLKNSAAFGGANACLVIGRAPGRAHSRRPIYLAGVAAVGRHGTDLQALHDAWRGERHEPAMPPPPRAPRIDLAPLEPSAAFAVAASAAALVDAGVRAGRRPNDQIGVIGASVEVSPTERRRLRRGIDERGRANLPVGAFARLVLNGPAAAVARALQLRGPHTAVSVGDGSGLVALALGFLLLQRQDRTQGLVCVGTHEPEEPSPRLGYGAAAAYLATQPGPIRIAAIGVGATEADARERALQGRSEPALISGAADRGALGMAPGLDDLQRLALVVHTMRHEGLDTALVSATGTASTAILLTRESP